MKWIRIKKTILVVAITMLIIGWAGITSLNLFCALTLQCNSDASGWWSLFLTTIGIPVLVFQLYSLRKTVKESIWEPKLDIGLMALPIDYQEVLSTQSLSTLLTFDPVIWSKFRDFESGQEAFFAVSPFQLIIRNSGKRVAKHIKIYITCEEFPGDTPPSFLVPGNGFKPLDGVLGYVFQGGESRIVYPKDFEAYKISLMSNITKVMDVLERLSLTPEGIAISDIIRPGKYRFRCKAWADGLEKPEEEVLEIHVLNTDAKIKDHKFESDK